MNYKRYQADYKLSDQLDKKGKPVYIYAGTWYSLDWDHANVSKFKLKTCALCVLTLILYTLIGLWDNRASHAFYVMLPYAALLLPLLFLLAGAWNCANAPDQMKREQYDKSVLRIRLMGLWVAIFAGLSATGIGVFIALYGLSLAEGIFFAGSAGMLAIGVILYILGNYAKKHTKTTKDAL